MKKMELKQMEAIQGGGMPSWLCWTLVGVGIVASGGVAVVAARIAVGSWWC